MHPVLPLVSVVLPVYNGARFVGEAIESIRQQTYDNWELLILDDGSDDASFDYCKDCASVDPRISVFRNDRNLGLAATMNRLVERARGKYIAIQEQDDVSVSERLALEVGVLESRPEIGLVSGIAAWLDDQGQVTHYFPGLLVKGSQYPQETASMVRYLYTDQCKVVNAACMFRRAILEGIQKPFDEDARMTIDWQFFLHVAHKHQILGILCVLVRMRRGKNHDNQTSKKEILFREQRRCIRKIYMDYRNDVGSPVNYWLYRNAMATQLTLEGRFYYARPAGWMKLLHAMLYHPGNRRSWQAVHDVSLRALNKVRRRLLRLF